MTNSHYFGYSDANDELDLDKYFCRSELFNQIKKGDKSSGKFVIHGIRGAGKTAICNMILYENTSKLVCKIDKSFGFDTRKLGEYAAPIEGLMFNLLLKELINQIKAKRTDFKNPQSVSRIDKLEDKLRTIFRKVISGTTLATGPLEFDLEKILASDVTNFSRFKINEYVEALEPALNEKRGYILIDDVDDVFIGSEKSAAFIEGLLRAVKEINKSFGGRLHCLVFLTSGLFKLFFENAKEYDKLRDFIAPMSWEREQLVELLAERIRDKHAVKGTRPHWEMWKRDFGGSNREAIGKIQDYVVSRCVSGPRDLILYCNMAKERAGSQKIDLRHIKGVEDLFSKEKLAQINRDFRSTYPQISEFLQQVFAGQRQTYARQQLMTLLNKRVVVNKRMHLAFGDLDYVRFATKENLLELLYGIGFLGFKSTKTSEIKFVIAHPEPGSKILNTAHKYSIHHAYKEYLNLNS